MNASSPARQRRRAQSAETGLSAVLRPEAGCDGRSSAQHASPPAQLRRAQPRQPRPLPSTQSTETGSVRHGSGECLAWPRAARARTRSSQHASTPSGAGAHDCPACPAASRHGGAAGACMPAACSLQGGRAGGGGGGRTMSAAVFESPCQPGCQARRTPPYAPCAAVIRQSCMQPAARSDDPTSATRAMPGLAHWFTHAPTRLRDPRPTGAGARRPASSRLARSESAIEPVSEWGAQLAQEHPYDTWGREGLRGCGAGTHVACTR